jgi:hypothetical protein
MAYVINVHNNNTLTTFAFLEGLKHNLLCGKDCEVITGNGQ